MREIKFRGIDGSSKFVYGYYLLSCGKNGREYDSIKDTDSNINNGKFDLIPTEVRPGTVGQYTGLKDKNGVEIYEGDIVRNHWTCKYKNFSNPPVYSVVFKDASFQFYADESYGNYKKVSQCHWPGEGCKPDNWEVIGNIHENPELLNQED